MLSACQKFRKRGDGNEDPWEKLLATTDQLFANVEPAQFVSDFEYFAFRLLNFASRRIWQSGACEFAWHRELNASVVTADELLFSADGRAIRVSHIYRRYCLGAVMRKMLKKTHIPRTYLGKKFSVNGTK